MISTTDTPAPAAGGFDPSIAFEVLADRVAARDADADKLDGKPVEQPNELIEVPLWAARSVLVAFVRPSPRVEPGASEDDANYARAVAAVIEAKKVSTVHVQRTLNLSYNAAAALIERMELEGVVTEPDEYGRRRLAHRGVRTPAEAGSGAEPAAWRSIETAPRDGGYILCRRFDRRPFVGWWEPAIGSQPTGWTDGYKTRMPTQWRPLYAAPQLALASTPAGSTDIYGTDALVDRFAVALKDKLNAAAEKYGRTTAWQDGDWQDDCIADMAAHVLKGDPRDVAAYCAFAWHHGWSVAPAGSTADGGWRVGSHYAIHVYEGDRPVATFMRAEDAQRAVLAVNGSVAPPPPGASTDAAADERPDTLTQERIEIEAEARRYADMYPQNSDGRNTFIIFAEWIAARSERPAPSGDSSGSKDDGAINRFITHMERIASGKRVLHGGVGDDATLVPKSSLAHLCFLARAASAPSCAGEVSEAAIAYFEALDSDPEKDCCDTETGEERPGAQKFASDWSWADWHGKCDAALARLRAAAARARTAEPGSAEKGASR